LKISYNWLKEYLPDLLSPVEVASILTSTGLEVESLDSWYPVPGGLRGLVIGEVRSVIPHPNAPRLKITSVYMGEMEFLSIVCGAPNVAAGQKVIVAPAGSTVFLRSEPIPIIRSKIRGEWSDGMICAEDEIGLGDSHEGILVLPADAEAGLAARDYYRLKEDFIFEIGITPNRSDALSHRGVARDVAAYLRKPFLGNLYVPGRASGWSSSTAASPSLTLVIEDPKDCLRFSGLLFEIKNLGDTPAWMKERLATIGVRPINTVVDITNYMLHDCGQPMHAYDRSRISGNRIIAGKLPDGARLQTLDGIERTLTSDDLVIRDSKGALGLAGVFGGLESSITGSTSQIFLECACFSPVAIRRTARRHGLSTDASFRFERGTDPELTLAALKKATELLVMYSGARVVSPVLDLYPEPHHPAKVLLRRSRLDTLTGHFIDSNQVNEILTSLGITISAHIEGVGASEHWELEVPLFRVDVRREVDVIEDILRIYGYDNIPIPRQLRSSLPFIPAGEPEKVRKLGSDLLASRGLHEIITNSLISSSFVADEGPEPARTAVHLLNPLSRDMDVMRQSMLFTGLKAIVFNYNRRLSDLRFFEFGKTYSKVGRLFGEKDMLGLYHIGSGEPSWAGKGDRSASGFFELKGTIESLFKRIAVRAKEVEVSETSKEKPPKPWLNSLLEWASPSGKVLASMGSVDARLLDQMEIDTQVWYGEVDWDLTLMVRDSSGILAKDIGRFPSATRDLSLRVPESVSYSFLKTLALGAGLDILSDITVFDVFRGEKIGLGMKSYALRFYLESKNHTLTDGEMDICMETISSIFTKKANAEVRNS